jgi:hypothetical protein
MAGVVLKQLPSLIGRDAITRGACLEFTKKPTMQVTWAFLSGGNPEFLQDC